MKPSAVNENDFSGSEKVVQRLWGYLFHDLLPDLIFVELKVLQIHDSVTIDLLVRFEHSSTDHLIQLEGGSTTGDLVNSIHSVFYSRFPSLLEKNEIIDFSSLSLRHLNEAMRISCYSDVKDFFQNMNKDFPVVITDKFNTYCAIFSTNQFNPLELLRYIDCVLLKDALYVFEKYLELVQKEEDGSSYNEMFQKLNAISSELDLFMNKTLNGSDRNYLRDVCIFFEKLIEIRTPNLT